MPTPVKPTTVPTWATDTNFASGPKIGQPVKVDPAAYADQGAVAGQGLHAGHLNYRLNELCDGWTAWGNFFANGHALFGFGTASATISTAAAAPVIDLVYSTITIANGGTLDMAQFRLFARTSVLVESGGTISVDPGETSGMLAPGTAGGAGGIGAGAGDGTATANALALGGSGGDGGIGDAGAAGTGGTRSFSRSWPKEIANLLRLRHEAGFGIAAESIRGGIGGGGGGAGNNPPSAPNGGDGGYGGGVLLIVAPTITIEAGGLLSAAGANGNSGSADSGGGGGGGGGGIVLICEELTYPDTSVFDVSGGTGGAAGGLGTSTAGSNGSTGNVYWIRPTTATVTEIV